MKKIMPVLLPVFLLILLACKEDKNDDTKTVTITAESNGVLTNTVQGLVNNYIYGSQGKELRMGWDENGYATRSFVTFDISSILPGSNEELSVNNAVLKVFESNTNMHPFDGDNTDRTVQIFLLDYGTLDISDFNKATIDSCGTLASWGYNALKEYELNVTTPVQEYYLSNPVNLNKVQFRLQFTEDNNVDDTDNSDLDASTWNIFSMEEHDEYVPALEINYTIKKK